MAIPEQFSLRWNDFHSNLSQSFQTFLAGEDLVDVTLAADGQYVHAHKLILSVCSPYFKELFKMNPCEHPIVFLKDVSRVELHQLLQFMYRGEVHVRQHELPAFLHTAELLQVKGLTATNERSESPVTTNTGVGTDAAAGVDADEDVIDQKPLTLAAGEGAEWGEELSSDAHPHLHHSHVALADEPRSPLKRLLKNTPNKNNYNVKKKPRPVSDGAAYAENADYASDSEPLIDFDNDFKMIHHHSVLVLPKSTKEATGWNCKSGGVKCPSCHRMFANRYNLKVHIRDKHDTREGTLQCAVCHKRMRNPSCLRVHMYHHRKQAAYLAQLAPPHHHLERLVQGMVGGAAPDWCEPVPDDSAVAPATPAANQNRTSEPDSVAVKSENCTTNEPAVIDNGAEVAPRREDVSEPE